MEKLGKSQSLIINIVLIGKILCSTTPPFLLAFEIFNKKVHNCLVNYVTSSNVIHFDVF